MHTRKHKCSIKKNITIKKKNKIKLEQKPSQSEKKFKIVCNSKKIVVTEKIEIK